MPPRVSASLPRDGRFKVAPGIPARDLAILHGRQGCRPPLREPLHSSAPLTELGLGFFHNLIHGPSLLDRQR